MLQTRYINCSCQLRTSGDSKINRKYDIKRTIIKIPCKAEESKDSKEDVSCGILWQDTCNSCAVNAVRSWPKRQWYQSGNELMVVRTSRLKCFFLTVAFPSYLVGGTALFRSNSREELAFLQRCYVDRFDFFPLATFFRHQSGFWKSLYPTPPSTENWKLSKSERERERERENSYIRSPPKRIIISKKLKCRFSYMYIHNVKVSETRADALVFCIKETGDIVLFWRTYSIFL